MIREKISRPKRSVPNKKSPLGGRIRAIAANGSCVATTGAKTATNATKTKKTKAIFEAGESALKRAPPIAKRCAKP